MSEIGSHMNQESPQYLVKKLLDYGFSQASVAKEISVSQSTISRIHSGIYKDPKNSVMNGPRCLVAKINDAR